MKITETLSPNSAFPSLPVGISDVYLFNLALNVRKLDLEFLSKDNLALKPRSSIEVLITFISYFDFIQQLFTVNVNVGQNVPVFLG